MAVAVTAGSLSMSSSVMPSVSSTLESPAVPEYADSVIVSSARFLSLPFVVMVVVAVELYCSPPISTLDP